MKKRIIERWCETADRHERMLYQEYVIFCNNATDKQFENFRKNELGDKEFAELVDFFYNNRCYLLLSRLLRNHRDNCIKPNLKDIKKLKLRKDITKRFKKLIM